MFAHKKMNYFLDKIRNSKKLKYLAQTNPAVDGSSLNLAPASTYTGKSLLPELLGVKPTHVISFIGRTHGTLESGDKVNTIDYLEYPGKLVENVRDNLFSPIILADLCIKYKIHYTYLGTGCIFNSENKKYTENDIPDYFGSSYSIVKGFTDRMMHSKEVLNLRIRMPISSIPNNRNFITKILNYSKICSIPNSMTVLDDFFPIFLDLMINKCTGTFNCTNPGTISHDDILIKYRELIDPTIKWENITISEQSKILKSDRSNNELDTSKIQEMYPQLLGIKDSIKHILLSMKKIIEN
jgi:dTDP-4-dehydrorhamnose reductase